MKETKHWCVVKVLLNPLLQQAEKPYKDFEWSSVLNDDAGPVGAAYEPNLEDDYFDDDKSEELPDVKTSEEF